MGAGSAVNATITGVRSVAAKVVTNPEVAKGVFPLVVPLTQRGVGEVIGWGKKGAADAVARMKSLTSDAVTAMQRQGINIEVVGKIRDFYVNEFARNAKMLRRKRGFNS